jgi:very-short-patch-repair endonuclease
VNRDVEELLVRSGGVILRREHPKLGGALDHLRRSGALNAVLPGVFILSELSRDWRVLARAGCRWDSDAVVTGEAAAALSFWPELLPTTVALAGCKTVVGSRGYTFSRRRVPPELITENEGIRIASPDLTALDLCATHGGDAIDRALRSRMTTLSGLQDALRLTPDRHGNRRRRELLLDSRDEPWSAAERLAHRLLRTAGITGWRTNVRFRTAGQTYFLDIYFARESLVVEIDGKVHLTPDMFETDRSRGNHLLLAGKRVLHFTWRMLNEEGPTCLTTVQRARAMGRRDL